MKPLSYVLRNSFPKPLGKTSFFQSTLGDMQIQKNIISHEVEEYLIKRQNEIY